MISRETAAAIHKQHPTLNPSEFARDLILTYGERADEIACDLYVRADSIYQRVFCKTVSIIVRKRLEFHAQQQVS